MWRCRRKGRKMWISFAKTSDALLIGRKRRTRRDWALSHARKFRQGQVVDAWNRNPRNGGWKIAEIELTRDPFQQRTKQMTMEDYELEGFAWMTERGLEYGGLKPLIFFHKWREANVLLWVIEFEVQYLTFEGMHRKLELEEMADAQMDILEV